MGNKFDLSTHNSAKADRDSRFGEEAVELFESPLIRVDLTEELEQGRESILFRNHLGALVIVASDQFFDMLQ